MGTAPFFGKFSSESKLDSKATGRAIRFFRMQLGMNQSDLADCCGVAQSRISSMEGGSSLSIDNLNSVAQALDVDVRALLDAAQDLKNPDSGLSLAMAALQKIASLFNRSEMSDLLKEASMLSSQESLLEPAWVQEAQGKAPAWRVPGTPEYTALQAEVERGKQASA
jgi:transcriptional regulator with XRE-family HTH domain